MSQNDSPSALDIAGLQEALAPGGALSRKELPVLGVKRLSSLERAASVPVPPMDLAKIVLPFNFR